MTGRGLLGRALLAVSLFLFGILVLTNSARGGAHTDHSTLPGASGVDPCCQLSEVPYIGSEKSPFTHEGVNAEDPPMEVGIVPVDNTSLWAQVKIFNQLVLAFEQPTEFHLIYDGKMVIIVNESDDGDNPDTFHILPPDGYIAVPPSVILDEGQEAIIDIVPYTLG